MSNLTRTDLQKLPPIDNHPFRERNQQMFRNLDKTCVIIDDDPTGNQTVYGVPLLASWDYQVLLDEFQHSSSAFFVLTNSRSLSESESTRIGQEISTNLNQAARATGRTFVLVSRSDSTLRGHFPSEIRALSQSIAMNEAITLLIPAMFEGGRVTVDDVHYVQEGEVFIPVAETPFSKDPVFGYSKSNLKDWIEEKSSGSIRAGTVGSVSLEQIRTMGADELAGWLKKQAEGSILAVNVLEYNDLDKVCNSILQAQLAGQKFLFRTSSSFLPSYLGLPAKGLLSESDLDLDGQVGGLMVVGSHVPKSSLQLDDLLKSTLDLRAVELDVSSLLGGSIKIPGQLSTELSQYLSRGQHVVLYTSRTLFAGQNATEALEIALKVSDYLVEVIRGLPVRPKFLVAKGGITSHDIAVKGLGMQRSVGMGQILWGVPMWEMGEETKFPGLPYVVFPGNVGGPEALTELLTKLS